MSVFVMKICNLYKYKKQDPNMFEDLHLSKTSTSLYFSIYILQKQTHYIINAPLHNKLQNLI